MGTKFQRDTVLSMHLYIARDAMPSCAVLLHKNPSVPLHLLTPMWCARERLTFVDAH